MRRHAPVAELPDELLSRRCGVKRAETQAADVPAAGAAATDAVLDAPADNASVDA